MASDDVIARLTGGDTYKSMFVSEELDDPHKWVDIQFSHNMGFRIPEQTLIDMGWRKASESEPKPIPKEHILMIWEYVTAVEDWLNKRMYLGGGSDSLNQFTAMTPDIKQIVWAIIQAVPERNDG